MPSDALTQFLSMNSLGLRKNSTKAAKIRALMRLQEVTNKCSKELLDRVEAMLQQAEEKRKKKAASKDVDNHDEDEDADEAQLIKLKSFY